MAYAVYLDHIVRKTLQWVLLEMLEYGISKKAAETAASVGRLSQIWK
jgi:hypothetical protein